MSLQALIAYPPTTNGLRLRTRSDHNPDTAFRIEATASAPPSTSPTIIAPAPRTDVIKSGSRGKIIWLDKSVKRLTRPRR
jgi:hypothetical protein